MIQSYIPKWPPFTFGGLENPTLEDSRAVIIPVPFDSTASYLPGSRHGPESIIDASRYMELFDHETGWSPCEVGIHTMPGIEPCRGDVRETLNRVGRVVTEVLSAGRFPVVLGGEHSVTIGAVEAASRLCNRLRVLILDAHCDLRDEYEGSRFSHACTARRITETVSDVTGVGMRSCSEEEWSFLRTPGLNMHFWKDGDRKASVAKLAEVAADIKGSPDPLYLSIDLDVFNPAEVPAVGTPEPSGPTYDDLLPLIKEVATRANLVGMDLVELTPIQGDHSSQFLAAKLLYKIIGYRFAPERRAT